MSTLTKNTAIIESLLEAVNNLPAAVDLSSLTVTPETLLEGVIAINAAGEIIVGTHKCSSNGGLLSSDGYVLKDANGQYLIAKETE